MRNDVAWIEKNQHWLFPFAYLFSRIILYLALIPTSYYGFGDLPVYYNWTTLPGWPYFNHWVEYPPLFPFTSEIIFILSNGEVFLYDFILCVIIALAGSGTIFVFQKIAHQMYQETVAHWRTVLFFSILLMLPYTWWYAELITVFLMILSVWWGISKRETLAGLGIAAGILSKWFPVFILPALFRFYSKKQFVKVCLIAATIVILTFTTLYVLSPQMTLASLRAQPNRSSWQTLWALLDGNLTTGAFLTIEDRLHPEVAGIPRGNPPVISPNLTLLVFAGIGIWFLIKRNQFDTISVIAFLGITWSLFLLWSPGWSPQWILYLLPLILLSFPISRAYLVLIALIGLTIFEWPLMLMRQIFLSLWIIVPLRMGLLALLISLWLPQIISAKKE
ncbi:hypothetical protein [Bellilinea sp.]